MLNSYVKVMIGNENGPFFGYGKYLLLKQVEKSGSLNAAAQELDISYKKAFSYINSIEEHFGETVLTRTKGKSAVLNDKGRELIKIFEFLDKKIVDYSKNLLDQFYAENGELK
ncbi:LysR family transcriptional regulator [bacterium]|nr:LysR family transcriptional regulator [bacterium]